MLLLKFFLTMANEKEEEKKTLFLVQSIYKKSLTTPIGTEIIQNKSIS